jgi:hypothetical protein
MQHRSPGSSLEDWNQGSSLSAPAYQRQGVSRYLSWWWHLTAPPPPALGAGFATRERARRGRLASVFLLVFLLIGLGALYQYVIVDDDHPAMIPVLLVAFVLAGLVGVLNRLGWVAAAGLILVGLADLPLPGVVATAVGGQLDVLHLGAFYLLVGSEIIAASVLDPWTVFPVAIVNSALAFTTIAFMPHTPALAEVLTSNNGQQAYAGPIVMQLIVAVVAYLWAQSTLRALRRADRAEEIAELERRELERTRELEEGAQQLLAVHVQLANGNFNVRVPAVRNNLLWQVGSSLNNLIGRLARLAQADFVLRRTQEEANHLTEAILIARTGRQAIWPAPSGTPLDEVVVALSNGGLSSGGASAPTPTLGGAPQSPAGPPSPTNGEADAPGWLFPRSPAAPWPGRD